ncbi:hypothetical protein KAU09_01650 [Candidatus Parcubacteria bacterium]|nr:hypothetical protein [Candidatus Parcubacteria bacterium]
MTHYYLEGLNCNWTIVRETPSSSKLIAISEENKKLYIDIHFTSSASVTVNILLEGSEDELSKGFLNPVMEDIERIVLKHGNYGVIDYTMGASSKVFDGNYSINKKMREIMNKDFRS